MRNLLFSVHKKKKGGKSAILISLAESAGFEMKNGWRKVWRRARGERACSFVLCVQCAIDEAILD